MAVQLDFQTAVKWATLKDARKAAMMVEMWAVRLVVDLVESWAA